MAQNRQRNQYEERMQAYGASYYFRIDIVAVNLLNQEKSQYREDSAQQPLGEKGDEKGGHHAEKRPEIRDYVQKTAD